MIYYDTQSASKNKTGPIHSSCTCSKQIGCILIASIEANRCPRGITGILEPGLERYSKRCSSTTNAIYLFRYIPVILITTYYCTPSNTTPILDPKASVQVITNFARRRDQQPTAIASRRKDLSQYRAIRSFMTSEQHLWKNLDATRNCYVDRVLEMKTA